MRPILAVLRLCANQISYIANLRDPKEPCCDIVQPTLAILRPCASQMSWIAFCATQASCGMIEFWKQKVHSDDLLWLQHDSRTIWFKTSTLRQFRLKLYVLLTLRFKMVMLRLCSTEEILCIFRDPNNTCCDLVRPKLAMLQLCARPKLAMLRHRLKTAQNLNVFELFIRKIV